MVDVFAEGGSKLVELYEGFIGFFPPFVGSFFNLALFVLLVVVYSILIWKFYRFISRKNPLGLDLSKYNKAEHSFLARSFTGLLYLIEYILILPFLIFIIFSFFTLLLLLLTKSANVSQILVISSVIIASIRMTAYYKESLSRELAKMLPFTLLAVSVLNPNTFSEVGYVSNLLVQIGQIPSFFDQVFVYLLFIIILEVILRFFDLLFSLFGVSDEVVREEE